MATAWYATREDVTSALDVKLTARNNRQVDRAIESASRAIEGLTHRVFRPYLDTREFDWPSRAYRTPWRLWLDANELISVSALVAGGVTIAAADYFLRPNTGPPFTSIEIDLSSSAAFQAGATWQDAIAITGLFGYSNDEEQVGTLAADLGASLSATATITWTTPRIGVGDVLRIDSERVIVTNKTMINSTQTLQTSMTAAANNVTVAVTTGSAFAVEEVILIDSERMLIVDIAGNNLTVKRAWDGSVLAAHNSGAAIYTLTGVELDRAQLGTVLAAHSNGATIYRHVVPGLVRDFVIAEAINTVLQESAGYARVAGSGENAREMSGKGLSALREDVYARYGRKARVRAV
jgi:hypothetical protein